MKLYRAVYILVSASLEQEIAVISSRLCKLCPDCSKKTMNRVKYKTVLRRLSTVYFKT